MSDESGPSRPPPSPEAPTNASGEGSDGESQYAQALRFLIALQSQKSQDANAQREFLRSKGLSDQLIDRAFAEVQKPQGRDASAVNTTAAEDASDAEAFDQAAKMFDDPLHAPSPTSDAVSNNSLQSLPPSLPAKTYPQSPLALYQSQPQGNASAAVSSVDNPLTRYHVLLRFFRSLCYFLVLGGGVASVAVALYRAYLMPRLIATLDARSDLLKHHRGLYATVAGRIRTLRNNSLAPPSQRQTQPSALANGNGEAASAAARKGVLKKVQFADEVEEKEAGDLSAKEKEQVPLLDDEDTKQAGGEEKDDEKKDASAGSDESAGDKTDSNAETAEATETPALPPIDILQPLRESLARLNKSLRADLSASAINTPLVSEDASATGAASKASTVEDESDAESWVSEEEDESEELEFDPFAAPSSKSSRKRKHVPKSGSIASSASSGTSAERKTATDASASTLKSSLNTLNAYINTQTYMANANVYGARTLNYGGIGSGSSVSNSTAGGSTAANKAGEVGQVRAEIRSLKGLLLSRRNFPIYSRPSMPRVGTEPSPVTS